MFTVAAIDAFAIGFVNYFFPSLLASIPNFPLPIGLSFTHFTQFLPFTLFTTALSVLTIMLFTRATVKPRKLINQSERAQVILATISLAVIVITLAVVSIWRYQGAVVDFLTWSTLITSGIILITFISVVFYSILLRERAALKQKELEQKIQQQYTERIEMQQNAMRQFKHDYQNILLSIDGFVMAEDWGGLEQYMPKVSTASKVITSDSLVLDGLSNIKPVEIKVLLVEKLMLAQNTNINISTTAEALEEIDSFPVDSVTLVRMLGIILDNAVEALSELGKGHLGVIVEKRGGGQSLLCKMTAPKICLISVN